MSIVGVDVAFFVARKNIRLIWDKVLRNELLILIVHVCT